MTINKLDNGRYEVDLYTEGRSGRRIRKRFKTKPEAAQYERYVLNKLHEDKDWTPKKKEKTAPLIEMVEIYNKSHLMNLSDGKRLYSNLCRMALDMGNPPYNELTADMFVNFRNSRIESGISKNTANHDHSYLRACINELIRLGHWKGENPLKNIRQIKLQEKELSYLNSEQITELLSELENSSNPHVYPVALICLATGARWGEAENLTGNRLLKNKIVFSETKGKKIRVVPISKELRDLLPNNNGKLFEYSTGAFRKAVERCSFELPAGQLTHVLRHSFASHYIMNGGRIEVLQKILGHSDIKLTLRYAHLAPEYLNDVVRLNPLAQLEV